jgi:hypothetical protein
MSTALRKRFPLVVLFLTLGAMTLSVPSATAQVDGFHGSGIAPRGVPASVTSFGFGGRPGFHGVPASVTSFGFGGHPGFHGVPASVTSTGFGANNGFRGFSGKVSSSGFGFRDGFHQPSFGRRHHHIHQPFVVYSPYYNYAPYPYPYYMSGDDYGQEDSATYDPPAVSDYRDDDDRRVLEEDYRAGLNPPREQISQPSEPVMAQPSTVLVFKDGHQQEISNYAIVGATLYDLSDGRSKKVQLADLDLTATVKENDQRGVEFQLPGATNLN